MHSAQTEARNSVLSARHRLENVEKHDYVPRLMASSLISWWEEGR